MGQFVIGIDPHAPLPFRFRFRCRSRSRSRRVRQGTAGRVPRQYPSGRADDADSFLLGIGIEIGIGIEHSRGKIRFDPDTPRQPRTLQSRGPRPGGPTDDSPARKRWVPSVLRTCGAGRSQTDLHLESLVQTKAASMLGGGHNRDAVGSCVGSMDPTPWKVALPSAISASRREKRRVSRTASRLRWGPHPNSVRRPVSASRRCPHPVTLGE
jgi:hypothetical protein